MILSGALNRERFKEYLTNYPLPACKIGDIVIADNLSCHKGNSITELVAYVGASIVYSPPYSSDLKPH
jgi:transposase